MKSTMVVKKRHFLYFLFLILGIGIISVATADYTKFGHPVDEIGPGTFSAGNYNFPLNSRVAIGKEGTTSKLHLVVDGNGQRLIYFDLDGSSDDGGSLRDWTLQQKDASGDFQLDLHALTDDQSFVITSSLGNTVAEFFASNVGDSKVYLVPNGGQVCINGDCRSSWPSGSGTSTSYQRILGSWQLVSTNPDIIWRGEATCPVGKIPVSGACGCGLDSVVTWDAPNDLVGSNADGWLCQCKGGISGSAEANRVEAICVSGTWS